MNDPTSQSNSVDDRIDTFCFSHLRWDFVYQRPQHLMSRFAARGRVYFIEEPMPTDGDAFLEELPRGENVTVIRPRLGEGDDPNDIIPKLIGKFAREQNLDRHIAWFYTPMMLEWKNELEPLAVVYDCMDELSAFRGAPPELVAQERRLFEMADVVFTGGRSLFEAKRSQHSNIHAFPSSIDPDHFSRAMQIDDEIDEQKNIGRPRVGFAGVIDERFDTDLLREVATQRPDLNLILVGPVVKISEDALPQGENIFYLGGQDYSRLPEIMAGWDVAMMPFAINESTRFISPTKTPEYLAAGLPVVSTAIADVVRPYGVEGFVHIAETAEQFSQAIDEALSEDRDRRLARIRDLLADMSWEQTFNEMSAIVDLAVRMGTPGGHADAAERLSPGTERTASSSACSTSRAPVASA